MKQCIVGGTDASFGSSSIVATPAVVFLDPMTCCGISRQRAGGGLGNKLFPRVDCLVTLGQQRGATSCTEAAFDDNERRCELHRARLASPENAWSRAPLASSSPKLRDDDFQDNQVDGHRLRPHAPASHRPVCPRGTRVRMRTGTRRSGRSSWGAPGREGAPHGTRGQRDAPKASPRRSRMPPKSNRPCRPA